MEGLRPHSCHIHMDQSELAATYCLLFVWPHAQQLKAAWQHELFNRTLLHQKWELFGFCICNFTFSVKKIWRFLMKLLPWQHLHSSLQLWLLFTSHGRFLFSAPSARESSDWMSDPGKLEWIIKFSTRYLSKLKTQRSSCRVRLSSTTNFLQRPPAN